MLHRIDMMIFSRAQGRLVAQSIVVDGETGDEAAAAGAVHAAHLARGEAFVIVGVHPAGAADAPPAGVEGAEADEVDEPAPAPVTGKRHR